MNPAYDATRREVAVGTHMLSQFGLATGVRASLGHVSVRVPGEPDRFVVKGRGYRLDTLDRMRPEDLVVCDLDGAYVEGPAEVIPCFEVKIHSCIYRARPDVQSVVHVHPQFTTIMSVVSGVIRPVCNEGNRLVMDPLPLYPKNRLISSEQDGQDVAKALGQGRAVLLYGHGAVTAGASMEQSITDMIHLEHQAEANYHAALLAGPNHPFIPSEMIEESTEVARRQWDLPHFQTSVARAGRPRFSGVWAAWYEDAAAEL